MANRAILRALSWRFSLLLALLVPTGSPAQDYLRSFDTDPILVYNGDGHRAPVLALLYTPDGKQLLTGGLDKAVLIWNLAENPPRLAPESLRPLIWKNKAGRIHAMALSPVAAGEGDGGGRLILGGQGIEASGGTLSVFRYPSPAPGDRRDTGELMTHWIGEKPSEDARESLGHVNTVVDLAFDPSGKYVASASNDEGNPIQIWDAAKGTPVRRLKDAKGGPKFRAARLVFTPDGSQLIAGAYGDRDHPDGLIRIWNLRAPAGGPSDSEPIHRVSLYSGSRAISTGIRALAISPDGRWLVAGLQVPISVAGAPNERSGLFLIDLKAPKGPTTRLLPFRRPDVDASSKKPYLGMVFDAKFIDSQRIVVAAAEPIDVPGLPGGQQPLATRIQIRSVPDGVVRENIGNPQAGPDKPWPGMTWALAIRPDRKQLAFVEGERGRVFLKDLDQPGRPAVGVVGAEVAGASIRRVGFVREEPAPEVPKLAYSGEPGAVPVPFLGFDLRTLQPLPDPVPPDSVAGARGNFDVYSVQPPANNSPFQLELTAPGQVPRTVTLDRIRHGQWRNWTFIPPAQGHPKPCLAIACEFGVAIYTLDDLTACKRFLDGHSADVLDLAPDPTGRWLVTGSADQTVRLWSLDGCDQPRPFGARFRRAGGVWVVDQVDERSPADLQGLKRGDWSKFATVEVGNQQPQLPEQINPGPAMNKAEPGLRVSINFNRPLLATQEALYREILKGPPSGLRYLSPGLLAVRKADSPVLSLFRAGQDWIVWMPQGYYETSVQGDRFYLGWHVNNNPNDILRRPAEQPRRTSFVPMITFQDRLRRPEILQRLLQTGSVLQALPTVPGGPVLTGPGPGKINEPPLDMPLLITIEPRPGPNDLAKLPGREAVRVNVAALPVRLKVEGRPGQQATRVRILDNGMEERVIDNPTLDAQNPLDLTFAITPGQLRTKTVEVTDNNNRVSRVDWQYDRPAPVEREGRLVVLAFGPEFSGLRDFAIEHAPKDAVRVGDALFDRIVQPLDDARPYKLKAEEPLILAASQPNDPNATAAQLKAALADFKEQVENGKLGTKADPDGSRRNETGAVDTLALFLNTHLLASASQRMILGEAGQPEELLGAAWSGEELAESLGYFVRNGCRVMVFVDGVHLPSTNDRKFDVNEWVRQLQAERVGTFVASTNNRPSVTVNDGALGAFGEAIAAIAEGEYGDLYKDRLSLNPFLLGKAMDAHVRLTNEAQAPLYYGSLTSWDFLPLVGRQSPGGR